jgi:hypothetical protein
MHRKGNGEKMGLDTCALPYRGGQLSDEDVEAFKKAAIELCGGLLSGNPGDFRGKVYSDLIWDITGQSLYQEWIPPEEVRNMYEKLEACNLDDFPDKEWDIVELRKFFKVCVQRHLGLAAS